MPEAYAVPTWGELSGLGVQEWITQQLLQDGNSVSGDGGMNLSGKLTSLRASLKEYCDGCLDRMATSSYGNPHGNLASDFPWGSNSEKCAGQGIALLYQYALSKDKKYLTAALADADYLFGRNATGYCFVTGFGTKQVMHPHQRLSSADGIEVPLPGFLAGGPNPGQQDKAYCKTYPSDDPDESYTDDQGSYASNEIAINWNAYLVALLTWLDASL